MLKLRATTAAAGAVALSALLTVPASASANDARQACQASQVTSESAYVPPSLRGKRFLQILSARGAYDVNCGDGSNYGAVKIELKHEVPNWAEAATCIEKAMSRGVIGPGTGPNTTQFKWSTSAGFSVVVVTGGNGIVTAYPTGGSEGPKWTRCAALP